MAERPSRCPPAPVVRFGVFEFDPETGDLWKSGRRTRLQEQPRQVLGALLARPGELVTRDELRATLWPDGTFVDIDTGLNVVINKIRQALDDSASAPRFVETLPRRGYRFIAPVAAPVAEAVLAPAVSSDTVPVRPVAATAEPRPTRSRPRALAAVVLASVAIVATWVWSSGTVTRPGPDAAIRSLAVLPLENLSGDESEGYLVEGITEALTTDLASIGALRVVARQSTKQYRGTTKPISAIGRELQVDAVIEGSVSRSTVQLIDVATDRHLWAHTYERGGREILQLQREAVQAISRAVGAPLTPIERDRLASRRAVDPAAYDAYLRGRYQLAGLAESEAQTARALAEFQRAVDIDPNYAAAYAGIATAQQLRSTVFQGQPPALTRTPAIAAARRALQIDPDLGEAHGILARLELSEFDWPEAETSFRRALELTPNDPSTLVWYAYQLLIQRRPAEALDAARRAEAVNPLDLNTRVRVAFIHVLARRFDDGVRRYEEVLALDPDRTIAKWFLAGAYMADSKPQQAMAVLQAAIARHGRLPSLVGQLAAATALSRRRRDAEQLVGELLALSRRGYVSPALLAVAYVALGDRDRAFDWLERAYEERANLMMYFAIHPLFDSLRDDPRYATLESRIRAAHTPR
jgi:TolB-like protein/DNA-binding winged helix-turn-helix (wHTH) protein/Tfp pilus assembly protein PilF